MTRVVIPVRFFVKFITPHRVIGGDFWRAGWSRDYLRRKHPRREVNGHRVVWKRVLLAKVGVACSAGVVVFISPSSGAASLGSFGDSRFDFLRLVSRILTHHFL